MTCIFCSDEKIRTDCLHETEHFRVLVGLGIATAGHVMIVPKEHLDCFAQIPKEWHEEYSALRDQLIALQTKHFAAPFQIEYGVWGQTVFHAHVHFIPHKGNNLLISDVMEEINPNGSEIMFPTINCDFQRMVEIFKEDKGYVFVAQNNREYIVRIKKMSETYKDLSWEFRQRIGYRHFVHKQNKCPEYWETITPEEKAKDDILRNITKEKLKF